MNTHRAAVTRRLCLGALASALGLSGCPDDGKLPINASCTANGECASGLCLGNVCVDPNGDEDADGLTNAVEGALGTNYLARDSDGDGVDDGVEVGGDVADPRDTDGDGLYDAIESSVADGDNDCLVDELDAVDEDPSAAKVLEVCSLLGLCGERQDALRAWCEPGPPIVWRCDYSGVAGYAADEDAACDGVDADCDGAADEDFAGAPTTCSAGACTTTGVMRCVAGAEVDSCTLEPSEDDPTCDGVDDDCDGATDEDYVAVQTGCGIGACVSSGVLLCVAGGPVDDCEPGPPAATDASCDAVDDDCDGTDDEDYAPRTITCGDGACLRSAMTTCASGAEQESCAPGSPLADTDPTCDGVDDDCDGATDEEYPTTATSCGAGACATTGTLSCVGGAPVDSCAPGTAAANDATCDGVDDDCGGGTDEDYVPVQTSCGVGACAATGASSCAGGEVQDSCTPGVPDCGDAACGDDGCGGSCGTCPPPAAACLSVACETGRCATDIAAGSCYIAGVCYAHGALDPATGCRSCDSATPTAWSNVKSGSACPDDGNSCTADRCDGQGACGHLALPDLRVCDDGDGATVMDGCWAGRCGGFAPRLEPPLPFYASYTEAARGPIREGVNAGYLTYNPGLQGNEVFVTTYGAALQPSGTSSFGVVGTRWAVDSTLVVNGNALWEWVNGAWTAAAATGSLRTAWPQFGAAGPPPTYDIIRRYAPSLSLTSYVYGVGRTASDFLAIRRCTIGGFCVPGPCGWSCANQTVEPVVGGDYAAGLGFFGGAPLVGTNQGSAFAPTNVRVLRFDTGLQAWVAAAGLSLPASNRYLRVFRVLGGGTLAGSPPEWIIGGGSNGLLFATDDTNALVPVDLGLEPAATVVDVVQVGERAVLLARQSFGDLSAWHLFQADLRSELRQGASWSGRLLDAGAYAYWEALASDGAHIFLVGRGEDADGNTVRGVWRFSVAAGATPSFAEDFAVDGAIPAGWTAVCEGETDPTANWNVTDGVAMETGNCYDVNSDETVVPMRGAFLWAPAADFGEGRLSVALRPGDNDGWGLMWGVQDADDYYRVSFDVERSFARVVRVVDGAFQVLAEDLDYAPLQNHWQRLEVRRAGATHTVVLNGGTVFTVDDATFPAGSVALYAWGMSDARFDEVRILPP